MVVHMQRESKRSKGGKGRKAAEQDDLREQPHDDRRWLAGTQIHADSPAFAGRDKLEAGVGDDAFVEIIPASSKLPGIGRRSQYYRPSQSLKTKEET
jgi:hypothetical protein